MTELVFSMPDRSTCRVPVTPWLQDRFTEAMVKRAAMKSDVVAITVAPTDHGPIVIEPDWQVHIRNGMAYSKPLTKAKLKKIFGTAMNIPAVAG